MSWLPVPAPAKIVSRVGLSTAAGGVGWLGIRLATPKTADVVALSAAIAVAAIAAALPAITESIFKRLAAIIRTWNEGWDTRQERNMQNKLLNAMLDPKTADLARDAYRMQAGLGRPTARKSPPRKPGGGASRDDVAQILDFPQPPEKELTSNGPKDTRGFPVPLWVMFPHMAFPLGPLGYS